MQYKLNETDEILDEIYPACKAIGGTLYIKCIQNRSKLIYAMSYTKLIYAILVENSTNILIEP